MRLSKSKYVIGTQCHRRLWWTIHDRDAPELIPDAGLQVIFDRGTRVGQVAQQQFPGGVLVELDRHDPEQAVAQTRAHIDAGRTTIFEASFIADDFFVAIDVLRREPQGWVIGEVKSTLSVKPVHLVDAAVQLHVARTAGLPIHRVEVIHLNRDHRHPDTEPLFRQVDVTPEVEALLVDLPSELHSQLAMLRGPLPNTQPGEQCEDPYTCPFNNRCWPRVPPHHLSELYSIRPARLAQLQELGYFTIHELPDDVKITGIGARQRRAIQENRVVVEDGLAQALATIEPPIAYLDFETISPALPVWPGCAPYQTIPVQFSAHLRDGDTLIHTAHLAEGPHDPREPLARALLHALANARTVLAYNAPFEAGCIRNLAAALPHLADDLHALTDRLLDLLPIVRNHVYHPEFHGSFSLKRVLPALVPHLTYDDLDIADGITASTTLEALLLTPDTLPQDPTTLRTHLLAYCHRDTEALLHLHDHLKQLAQQPTPVQS